jgi:hypothetical protein
MTITRREHDLHTLFIRTPLSHTEPPRLQQGPVLFMLLVGFLLFSLGACSAGESSTTVPPHATGPATEHPSPTPTRLPAGIVLYQADWSHGLVGWQGTQGWKVVQGQLETDSSGSATLTIPYQLAVSDYAVEIRLQIVRLLSQNGGSSFSIFATRAPGKDGYQAGASNLVDSVTRPFGTHPQSQAYIDPYGDMSPGTGLPVAYFPGFGWRTYRVEVQGNEVRLLADGVQIASASSEQTAVLSNGPLGLSSELVILRVSSVRIITL